MTFFHDEHRFSSSAVASRRLFTLVELLVVIAIIGILASFLMPALSKSLDLANSTQCLSQQRQVYIAYYNYAEQYNGAIPKGSSGFNPNDVHRGQSMMLDDAVKWGSHHPAVFVCPVARKLGFWSGNRYTDATYKLPSYYPNPNYWPVTQKFSDPKSGTGGASRKPSKATMLGSISEDMAKLGGTYLWEYVPERFGYYHRQNTIFNALYFDGHTEPFSRERLAIIANWRGY